MRRFRGFGGLLPGPPGSARARTRHVPLTCQSRTVVSDTRVHSAVVPPIHDVRSVGRTDEGDTAAGVCIPVAPAAPPPRYQELFIPLTTTTSQPPPRVQATWAMWPRLPAPGYVRR